MKNTGSRASIAACVAVVGAGVALAVPSSSDSWRTMDGTNNNAEHPEWGSTGMPMMRMSTVSYGDGVSAPAGADRPSPRLISNIVCAQPELMPNSRDASDFLWQWGQFIDHDITLIDVAAPAEPFDIPVPLGDEYFDPKGTGDQWILLDRSAYLPGSGTDETNPRQQVESITAFIDASQVYGSDDERAIALRTMDGTGRLKTSEGNLLPFNVDGLPNLGGPDPNLFLAGDIRANEQVGLTSMHTLFVREHNRLADKLAADPSLTGEEIYQRARAMVGAEIQAITYRHFLPLLIGPDAIEPYAGYEPQMNPGIANIFATAAYRVGHTLLSPVLRRLDANGETLAYGDLPLRDAFFAVHRITDEGGIAPILRGLASQRAQEVDAFVIDDVRNFLFGNPGQGGFDLPSLNVQRGRDHGLPSYNQARIDFELAPAESFSDITSNPELQLALETAYGDVDKIDVWVGGLAEDHVEGAMVGPLLQKIIADQFTRLRDGDWFWYENVFRDADLQWLQSITLTKIIRMNTEIDQEIQDDVFFVTDEPVVCAGDVTGDEDVNVEDLIALLGEWGQSGPGLAGDLNGDELVDVQDLVIVIVSWGPCGSS